MDMVSTCYTSCGCNRTPHSLHWGRNGVMCYGACRAIALHKSQHSAFSGSNVSTHVAHKDRVNAVKWIQNCRKEFSEKELVSGSTDKTAIVWTYDGIQCQPLAKLEGHTNAITVLDALYIPDEAGHYGNSPRTLVVTASVDSTVKIWGRGQGKEEFICTQTISFGTGFALAVTLYLLPETNVPVLACAGDDMKIQIFVEQETQFMKVLSLVGHEDWVRGLEFTHDDAGDLLLASAGQDCFIRIWRISPREPAGTQEKESSIGLDGEIKMKENTINCSYKGSSHMYAVVLESFLSRSRPLIYVSPLSGPICAMLKGYVGSSRMYAVVLESVLSGHDNWVCGVHWQPAKYTDGSRRQEMCLLSASMDKTMILWKPDKESGVWIEQVRVGEVGGNTLGFYGCQFSPDGTSIIAHGFQGAFHVWTQDKSESLWTPTVTLSGHFSGVEDIAWSSDGQFLLSCSSDQTTRLHAPWVRDQGKVLMWHEIARPQVHGYDMTCLAMIGKYAFASAGDEKVTRIFEAPRNFIENFSRISGVDVSKELDEKGDSSLPQGASVPALGLSNKAIFQVDSQELYDPSQLKPNANEQYSEVYFKPIDMNAPPTEDNLLQNTLWPETQKLYGHGYEVFAMAANPQGTVLVTCCKASKPEHAAILVWDVSTWRQSDQLLSHSLTITQLAFSHSGQYLLSVSRDRTWSLFKQKETSPPSFSCIAKTDKKSAIHTRIIWACAWSHDDKFFTTVSRDKKVIVWGVTSSEFTPPGASDSVQYGPCCIPLELPDSVTAVDMAPVLTQDKQYLLAIGLDNGVIFLYKFNSEKPDKKDGWTFCHIIDNNLGHHLTVTKLQFRKQLGFAGVKGQGQEVKNWLQLASCGRDNLVKIHNIDLTKL